RVSQDVRTQRRVRVVPIEIRRRDHELETFRVGRWTAIALIHVPAGNPSRTGRDSDLVAKAIVADRGPRGVSALTAIVARRERVRTAGAAAGVNGIVPIEIVIGAHTIPAAILRLQRVMRPALARILISNYDACASEPHGPDRGSVHVSYAPFHGSRSGGIRRGETWGSYLRIFN